MFLSKRPFWARIALLGVLAAAMLAVGATAAFAEPADEILTLQFLQERLQADDDGRIEGQFLTVVRGTQVETMTCELTAVTGDDPNNALIMFEATDPRVLRYGGIAAGMSGSPLYIKHPTEDRFLLVGAVSYADSFSLHGTGLATPIEAMIAIENGYAEQVLPLGEPVLTSDGPVDRIIVTADPEVYEGISGDGTLIAKPLAPAYIGGLKPTTGAYRALAKALGRRGQTVVPLAAPLAAQGSFAGDFAPGSAVTVADLRGDVWSGGIGTVTYNNNGNVLAFGHPANYTGDTSLYLAGATIDGVWPNQWLPYKVGRVGTIQGEVVQDRAAGVMGVVGPAPVEVPINAAATYKGTTHTSESFVTKFTMNTLDGDHWYAVAGASQAGYSFFDKSRIAGSARTTTTVEIDDNGVTRTVSISNLVSDSYDLPFMIVEDCYNALSSLRGVLDYGVEKLDIVSVNVESEIVDARREATIVGVDITEPLKTGDNVVTVSFLPYGDVTTRTATASLTIPAGVALNGTLSARPAVQSYFYSDDEMIEILLDMEDEEEEDEPFVRPTIASIVDDLNTGARNDQFVVSYVPEVDEEAAPGPEPKPVTGIGTSEWVVDGSASRDVTTLSIFADPKIAFYNDIAWLWGEVDGPTSGVVSIYGTPAGGSESLLATAAIEYDGEIAYYEVPVFGLTTTTGLRARVEGDAKHTLGEARGVLPVYAKVSLKSSATRIRRGTTITLTAKVSPAATAGSKVVFQRLDGRTWRTITTQTLLPGASYSSRAYRWRPPAGTVKVRARFLGGPSNAATTGNVVTLTVR